MEIELSLLKEAIGIETWNPSREYIEKTNAYHEYLRLGFKNWGEYYKWSITNSHNYWESVEAHYNLKWQTHYDEVFTRNEEMSKTRFFTNGKINLVDFALSKLPNSGDDYVFYENEAGISKSYSYKKWKKEIYLVAENLQVKGLSKGDRVLFYVPMTIEMSILYFAVTMLGAIVCPVFSGFKKDSVKNRLDRVQASWLITSDATYRKNKKISLIDEIMPILDEEIKHCIVISDMNFTSTHEKISTYQELLINQHCRLEIPLLDANDITLILFTSGTTGKPKAVMHSQLGFPLKSAWDAYIGFDVKKDDCLFWYTDLGWMMGPFLLWSSLLNGAKLLLYEGAIETKKPNALFMLIKKYNITHAGISPGLIRVLAPFLRDKCELIPSLKAIGSTGEPWNDVHWNVLTSYLGEKGFPIFNYSGGTEISGGIFGNLSSLPQIPSGFNTALPGMNIDITNSIDSNKGELTIVSPWLGMTLGFYGEKNTFQKTYFKEENKWFHGDYVEKIDEFYFIRGRSDDTINVGGKRIGPQEIETVISAHKDVKECAVISVHNTEKGEKAIAFVVANNHVVESELFSLIETQVGKMFRPANIYFVQDLPKTRNGKVMRQLVKKAYLHETVTDTSSLQNEQSLIEIKRVSNGEGEL